EVRGEGPLQPKKAKAQGYEANSSPVGRLFNAFRRNDPGTKCLIPGNRSGPLHEAAREWATQFRRGLPEYLTDDKWYEAAQEYDDIKRGKRQPAPGSPNSPGAGQGHSGGAGSNSAADLLDRTGLGGD